MRAHRLSRAGIEHKDSREPDSFSRKFASKKLAVAQVVRIAGRVLLGGYGALVIAS